MTDFEISNRMESNPIFSYLVKEIKKEYLCDEQDYPWIVGFSGGKDSTLVAHLVFEAIFQVAPSKRSRQIHVISNDTLVESPFCKKHHVPVDVFRELVAEQRKNLHRGRAHGIYVRYDEIFNNMD